MTQIKIWNKAENNYLMLPKTRDITTSGQMLYEETEMMSGKIVMDIRGYRNGFSANWDYFPAATLTSLLQMIRQGGFFKVEFSGDEGVNVTGYYKVEQNGGMSIFKFVDNFPMWHGLSLDFTAQAVSRYE